MSRLTTAPFRPQLLYLDFDGVLHTHDVWFTSQGPSLGDDSFSGGHRLLEHAGLLAQVLAPYPFVQIVLSTAWVHRFGLRATQGQLPEALRTRVIGATFDPARHTVGFASVARGYQVVADVAERKPSAWLALDDDVRDWPDEHRVNLVTTDRVLGISEPTVLAQLSDALERTFGVGV
jgi:hypothetical protein